MYVFHDSHSAAYRRPFGAAVCGSAVFLAVDTDSCAVSAELVAVSDLGDTVRIPMLREQNGGGFRFSASIDMPDTGTLVWYHFAVTENNGAVSYFGNNSAGLGGKGAVYDRDPPGYQITVYKHDPAPDWYKKSIAYQIFPDRFFRGPDWRERRDAAMAEREGKRGIKRVFQENWDDTPFYTRSPDGEITRWPFFGGTLEGVREKLGYLKDLGVGVIYLNPIFKASSNHRYDTADFTCIDPMLGDEESFSALCKEAEKFGMRIILDGVFNHTGADSVYFDRYGNYGGGAYSDPNSEYTSWFNFRSGRDDYESWWGVKDLPSVNENSPSYREFICTGKNSIVRRWLRAGASGWRLDVADELPDSFICDIRRAMNEEKPDSVLLGEVWEDASNKISYGEKRRYFMGDELHSTMNYPFRTLALDFMLGKIGAGEFYDRIMSLKENYPPENFYASFNLIGSHDRRRIFTVLGDTPEHIPEAERETYRLAPDKADLARRRLKVLSLLQFAMPGVPCIYYGDETAVQGLDDPYNRAPFPWDNTDTDMLWHYRAITSMRNTYRCLTEGSFEPLTFGEHVFGCRRVLGDEEIVVLINRGVFEHVDVALPTEKSYVLDLLQSREYSVTDGCVRFSMLPVSAVAFYIKKKAPEKTALPRSAGVLCHVTSIPSASGQGDLGAGTRSFLNFLKKSGQKLWQILPLNPVGDGDSPYMSPSVFAGDERLISPDIPIDMSDFEKFCTENEYWLPDHALYTALREKFGTPWQQWPECERERTDLAPALQENSGRIEEIKKAQYIFHCQWQAVREYAHGCGISIIGDIPVFASSDSADVWAHREFFMLTEDGGISLSGGAPPDGFTPDGQNWCCPLYNWPNMEKDGFRWWRERVKKALGMFDCIRLDHFRGFSAYYAIPFGKTGKDGFWMPGPGMKLFNALSDEPLPMIAEDLGMLDTGVYNLLRLSGYPGMNVWQFSEHEMRSMPPEKAGERVFYSGTHDNDTLVGWCSEKIGGDGKAEAQSIVEELYRSQSPWVILPLQDMLLLGSESRMNTPGTCGGSNWHWVCSESLLTDEVADRFSELSRITGR